MRRRQFLAWTATLLLLWSHVQPLAAQGSKIDINRASRTRLTELPGIGPALAGRIVEYREKNGPFKRIEELMNVRGIGEKKFLKMEKLVTVGVSSKEGQGGKPPTRKTPGRR